VLPAPAKATPRHRCHRPEHRAVLQAVRRPAHLAPHPGLDRSHLTIVFVALAASRWIEYQTRRSIRKFVKTARRYRTI
jgi:hypothetical protein